MRLASHWLKLFIRAYCHSPTDDNECLSAVNRTQTAGLKNHKSNAHIAAIGLMSCAKNRMNRRLCANTAPQAMRID